MQEIYVTGFPKHSDTVTPKCIHLFQVTVYIMCLYIKWFVAFSIFVNIYKTSFSFQMWFKDLNSLLLTQENDKCDVKQVRFLFKIEHDAKISLRIRSRLL